MESATLLERTALDDSSPVPLHHQLSSEIARQVRRGALRPGTRLPAVLDLCQSLNLSITTVNRSLQDLKRQGYVTTRRGHGTFVAPVAAPTTEVILSLGYEYRNASESLFDRIVDGLRRGGDDSARRHVMTQFPDYFPDAREVLELCRLRRSDSVVIYRPPTSATEVLATVARQKAVVALLRNPPGAVCDCVLSWPQDALADWMRRQYAEGRRKFVYVGKTSLVEEAAPYGEVFETFKKTVGELGLEETTHLHRFAARRPGDGRQTTADDAATAESVPDIPGDAVLVAQTPHIAAHVMLRHRTGPAISYTESDFTLQTLGDRMTVLYLDFEKVGAAAAELIRRRLTEPDAPLRTVHLAPETIPATGPGNL